MDEFKMTLDGEGFNALKSDFNSMFNSLINSMVQKESETGEISIKLKISLQEGDGADGEIIGPKFEHTITSAFQMKNKRTGSVGGDTYQMEWDKERLCYVMSKIDKQISIFDNDGRAPDYEPEDDADAAEEEEGGDDA